MDGRHGIGTAGGGVSASSGLARKSRRDRFPDAMSLMVGSLACRRTTDSTTRRCQYHARRAADARGNIGKRQAYGSNSASPSGGSDVPSGSVYGLSPKLTVTVTPLANRVCCTRVVGRQPAVREHLAVAGRPGDRRGRLVALDEAVAVLLARACG